MDDALFVSGLERGDHLTRDPKRGDQLNRPAGQPVSERGALDELHCQGKNRLGLLDTIDLSDIGMVERGQDSCLALETGTALGVGREALGQYLQSDVVSIQPHVASSEHFAHRPGAVERDHLIRPEPGAGLQRHGNRVRSDLN